MAEGSNQLLREQLFSPVDSVSLFNRLQRPTKSVDVVLDTDTYNEIDDQFALSYMALSSDKMRIKAILAAPFCNEKADMPSLGMERSYEEIKHITTLLQRPDLFRITYKGADRYLPDETTPVNSTAAQKLIGLAMQYSPERPLYVVAIGAITNIASALLLQPEIRDRMVVVWLGGHALHWHDNREFNLKQDIAAARVILGCGVAVVLLPCMGVVSSFITTETELRKNLDGKNALCDYLCSYTIREVSERSPYKDWSKQLWDVAAVGWLAGESFTLDEYMPSPVPEYDGHWGFNKQRHLIRYVYHINRDPLIADLFQKLTSL